MRGIYTVKSANKYHSIKFLKKLRENNYRTINGIEYNEQDVDAEYFQKSNTQHAKTINKIVSDHINKLKKEGRNKK